MQQPQVPTVHKKALLSYITDGATVQELELSQCIPLYLYRKYSTNAVMRLISILSGEAAKLGGNVQLTGLASGPPTSIVVPLVGDLHYIVNEHLEKTFPTEEEIQAQYSRHSNWFGIIDGCFFHAATSYLCEKEPGEWSSFRWKLYVVRPGLELKDYRKLAVCQNEKNKAVYHYETTIFEMLHRLRSIYDEMHAARKKLMSAESTLKSSSKSSKPRPITVPHKEVAEEYDGGDHSTHTTVRQTVSVASRLSLDTIDAIGQVVGTTCADVILHNDSLNSRKLTSVNSVLSSYDCRLFKRFVSTSTLRGARNFMNAVRGKNERAQVNCIFRLRHWCELNEYRSVRPNVLNDQYRYATLALTEEKKFLDAINASDWPSELTTTRENILRSTVFDNDLEINEANTTDVLPAIWASFKRVFPARAKALEGQWKSGQTTSVTDTEEDNPPPAPDLDSSTTDHPTGTTSLSEEQTAAAEKAAREEREKQAELERNRALRIKADGFLKDEGISVYKMNHEDFIGNVWLPTSERVDLILSALPSNFGLASSKRTPFPAFCTSVLQPGGYVFLVLNASQFLSFYQAFKEHGFKVSDDVFTIVYDTTQLRRRRTTDFPQSHTEFALIARKKGHNPSGFVPDFAAQQSDTEPLHRGLFASILNVEQCDKKLKKPGINTPLFPTERSISLHKDIVRLFTPCEGSVMDPFGGALSTALACLNTGRSCTIMDDTSEALDYAIGRLRIFATPTATMAHLHIYTDVPTPTDPAPQSERVHHLEDRDGCTQSKKRRLVTPLRGDSQDSDSRASSGEPITPLSQSAETDDDTLDPATATIERDNLDDAKTLLFMRSGH